MILQASNLTFQILISVVTLVLLTAAAVGLPAILLVRQQLEQQAWALAEQGGQTTRALLAARQSDLSALALLTAQRPTLHTLLQTGSSLSLTSYLETLRSGAALNGILLCGPEEQIYQAGENIPGDICPNSIQDFTLTSAPSGQPAVWLLAEEPVAKISGWQVVVGLELDADLMRELERQTGLKQALYINEKLVAHSFDPQSTPKIAGLTDQAVFADQGIPYYGLRSRLNETGLMLLSAVAVSSLAHSQQQLTLWIGLGIIVVAALGSTLGIWRARALSKPLQQLRGAAELLRSGDLFTPIRVQSKLEEVNQMAYALEDARATLQHTLLQLKQEKAWSDQLLESIIEGIITFDRQNKITFFSPGAAKITGYAPGQANGKRIDDLFLLSNSSETFSQRLPAPGARQKLEVLLPKNRKVTLSITRATLALPDTGRASTVLVLRDVSDEEAVRHLLGDFLANITHEFRTPLAALAASAELMLDQLADLNPEELRELLASLRLGIFSLQTLIDNLLEGASIETGSFRVTPRPNHLYEIIETVTLMMQPLFEKYRQQLVLEVPNELPEVIADAKRTQQVLVNLLSNAIKWSPEGSQITLTVAHSFSSIRVAISDQGPGIPAALHHELFQRFAHVRNQNERAEYGAGIGLSVVKAIVEAQGGQVGVEDAPGGGASFIFTLLIAKGEIIL